MARWRVYIQPFETDGTRSGTYVEVTDDVLKLGSLSLRLDHAEFDVGIFRNSSLTMTLRNDHGRFLAPPSLESMFSYKRSDCLVKITWDYRDYDLCVGFFTPGNEPFGGELTMFEGLLDDTAGAEKIDDHVVDFTILGFESLLDKIDVPYADITAGADYISDVIETCLNQTLITDLLTVDAGNISVGQDAVIDDKSSLENKTVKDALKSLLFGSNSVLFIKDRVVYVTDRSPSATVLFTFYGQASIAGIENIINIPVYRDGLNRTFNHWTWKDVPSLVSSDATSILTYGIRSKEIDVEVITDTSKRQSLLDENKNEFRNPLTEFEIVTPINYDTYLLGLLDRVSIDYPTVYFTADGGDLPRYGQAIYGEAVLPVGVFTVTIDSSDNFKIIEKQMMPNKHQFKFTLRKVPS